MNLNNINQLTPDKNPVSIVTSSGLKFCRLFMFILIVFAGFGCNTEEGPEVNEPPSPSGEFTQYGEPFQKIPETSDIVMYEVNLYSFSESGDLKGVQGRLDELKELGVNVVWLMPIHPIGQERGIGSPYAIRNFMQVNSKYGNIEDLRELVKEAHKRDMAVILDLVANHTSWDHQWIQNPSWYLRDGSGNILSPPGMGWEDVAQLNYSNQALRTEMIKTMKYWVLEANVDGYRCDYAEGVPTDFWKQAIDSLRIIPNREVIMFAEAVAKDLYGAGFDMTFGWNFYHRLKETINDNQSVDRIVTANTEDYRNVAGGKHVVRWIDNHDDNAWYDTPLNIFRGQRGKMAAFVITAYTGGVPLIYNGQEVAFPTRLPFFEHNNVKIDWSLNPDILEEYKNIINFRQSSFAVRNGSLQPYHTRNVMAFKRVAGFEEVAVIVNVRNSTLDYDIPAAMEGNWENVMDGSNVNLNGFITLGPFSYMILKK